MVPFKGANGFLPTGQANNKLHQNIVCKNKTTSSGLCVSERKLFRMLRVLGQKVERNKCSITTPTTKRKIWKQWHLLLEGTTTYIFLQIAGKLYKFLLLIGGVFSGELLSILLYRVLSKLVRLRSLMPSRVRRRGLARLLCRGVQDAVQGAVPLFPRPIQTAEAL